MVILNGNAADKVLKTDRFSENIRTAKKGIDVIRHKVFEDISQLTIPAHHALIIELQ
jgi:hypothetical protein